MSASAKPTEKVFKSFLAAVLAISLCPLMPADKAQAEEAGNSGEPTDAAQVSDEGEGEETDLAEGIVETDSSNADLNLAEGDDGAEDEGALDDSNVALQAASDSGTPIVNWTKCGTCQWMIDSSGCLIIEPQSGETGELEDWGWTAPWSNYKNSIISATIKKTVIAKTTQKAFYDCKSLRSVDLSGLDTSKTTSMNSMFYGCSKLSSLGLSGLDASSVTDMSYMFDGCSSLASLDLSSFDTSKATSMNSMFCDCSKLASLDLSGLDASSATDMSYMFCDCSSLASLDLSGLDASSATDMSCMFYDCSKLFSLDLSGLDASSVTDMSYMFSYCSKLFSLDLSGLDASSVTDMSCMFRGCYRLSSLSLSGLDASSVTDMSCMFDGCFSLSSLDLSSFDTSKVTGMSHMFYGCSRLSSLNLSSFDTSKVTGMSYMFYGCSSLASLDLSGFSTAKVVDMSGVFSGCSSLASLDLSGFSTAKVVDMSFLLHGCSSLQEVNFGSINTSNVSKMSGMLDGAYSLRKVILGDKFTFNGRDVSRMCSLPTPKGNGITGLWVSSADGKAYAPDEIPNNVAATYTAQMKSEVPKTSISESMFAVDTRAKTYTGSPIKPSVSSGSLQQGTDYGVSYFENVNAGEGTILITGAGNYTGQITYSFRIDPIQVDAPKAAADLVYSGAEQVGVAPSDDYEVAGGSATDAGDYTAAVSLKDKRNYVWAGEGGSDDLGIAWAIAKAAPSYSAPAVVDATFGQTLGGLELPGGFSWQDDPSTGVGDAGEHEFMATFTPSDAANYNVVRNIPVIVRVSSPNLVAVPQVADLVYTGEFQKAAVPESDFYAVEEACGGIDAGAYEVKLSLKEPSSCRWADDGSNSEKTVTYRILPAQLTDVVITGVPARMEATGSQLTPKPIVTFNGKTLAQGADYSLSYGENVSPGKGTVTVTAIEGGNFTGSATVEFDIEKKAEPAPEPAPEPQQFAVIYHLDGGVNATDNPATYMAGTAVPLADPTKEGFEFQGWYADAEFTVRVTEIPSDASGDVELWAKWKEQKPAPVFSDVDYSSWYGDAVSYVASKGLITGYSGTTLFGVGDVLTRAQLATILWRNACPDEYASYDPETAVDTTGIDGSADGMYYTAAANWAVRNGVITGFDREDGSKDFAADDDVSFEQLVTILSRLCATPEELSAAGSDLSAFADGDLASSWSRGAFAWAAAKGLVQGYDEPTGKYLRPGDPVARERVAVVLMRAFEMGVMK